MAEKQRVLIVEDDDRVRLAMLMVLADHGHEVAGEAATPSEFTNVLECFGAELSDEVDVVLVDGDLTPRSVDGSDGEAVIDQLRIRGFGGVILGISGRGELAGADGNPGKDVAEVLQSIANIGSGHAA